MTWGCWNALFGPIVPEELCRPGPLYKNERIDGKKLRKLIQDGRLCPCFGGQEEASPPPPEHELYCSTLAKLLKKKNTTQDTSKLVASLAEYESCPICLLHYPVLNTSRCCSQRVCTECYLQVQTARSSTPPCPFCKVPGYSAKFINVKTNEAREEERVEEQKVIEARIREREEEIQRDIAREEQRAGQRAAVASGEAPPASISTQPAVEHRHAALPPIHGTMQQHHSPAGQGTAEAARRSEGAGHAGRAANHAGGSPNRGGRQRPGQSTAGTRGTSGAEVVSLSQLNAVALAEAQRQMEVEALAEAHGLQPTGFAGNRQRAAAAAAERRARAVPAGAGGGYRLADYVPTGVADIAVDVEDINDFMLEQAMYESLAAAGGDGLPGQAAGARLSGPGQVPPAGLTSPGGSRRNHIMSAGTASAQPMLVLEEGDSGSGLESMGPAAVVRQALQQRHATAGATNGPAAVVQQALNRNRGAGNADAASRFTLDGLDGIGGRNQVGSGSAGAGAARNSKEVGGAGALSQRPAFTMEQRERLGLNQPDELSEEQELELAIQLSLGVLQHVDDQPRYVPKAKLNSPPKGGADASSSQPAATAAGHGSSQLPTATAAGHSSSQLPAATAAGAAAAAAGMGQDEDEGGLVSVRAGSGGGVRALQLPSSPARSPQQEPAITSPTSPTSPALGVDGNLQAISPSAASLLGMPLPPLHVAAGSPVPPTAEAAPAAFTSPRRATAESKLVAALSPPGRSPTPPSPILPVPGKSSSPSSDTAAQRRPSVAGAASGSGAVESSTGGDGLVLAVGSGEALVKAGPLGESVMSPSQPHPSAMIPAHLPYFTATLSPTSAHTATNQHPLSPPTTLTPPSLPPISRHSSSASLTELMERVSPAAVFGNNPGQPSGAAAVSLDHNPDDATAPWLAGTEGEEVRSSRHPWGSMTNPMYDMSPHSSTNNSLKSFSHAEGPAGVGEQPTAPAPAFTTSRLQRNSSNSAHAAAGGLGQGGGVGAAGAAVPARGTAALPPLPPMQSQSQRVGLQSLTAEQVAAAQPNVIHLGMVFTVWDSATPHGHNQASTSYQQPPPPQQPQQTEPLLNSFPESSSTAVTVSTPILVPDMPNAGLQPLQPLQLLQPLQPLQPPAIAGPSISVEAYVEDGGEGKASRTPRGTGFNQAGVSIQPQRLMLVQNPDGTICGAAAPLPPPVPVHTAGAPIDAAGAAASAAYSRAFLQAEARRLAEDRNRIDAAAYAGYAEDEYASYANEDYGDYDMDAAYEETGGRVRRTEQRTETVADGYLTVDAVVAQSISERDARLQAAFGARR